MKNILPAFEIALNVSDSKRFREIYGKNSYSRINKIYYSGQKKCFVADVTLFTDQPELLQDSFETFDEFIRNAWRYVGIKENLVIIKNFDLPDLYEK